MARREEAVQRRGHTGLGGGNGVYTLTLQQLMQLQRKVYAWK